MIVALATETTTALITGGAALGGALIGGMIGAGTTGYFEHRRDIADLRQALRLVLEEIRTVWIHLDGLVTTASYPRGLPASRPFLPTAQWEENRPALARHLDDDVWDALSPFMDSIPTVRALVAEAPVNTPIPAHRLQDFAQTRELAEEIYSFVTGGNSIAADATPVAPRRQWWRRLRSATRRAESTTAARRSRRS